MEKGRALTWNYYVPLSCQDIHNLMVRHETDDSETFWFGTHPIRWVTISGKVVSHADKDTMIITRIDDGTGSGVDVFQRGVDAFSQNSNFPAARKGIFIVVHGQLMYNPQFGWSVTAHSIRGYRVPSLQTECLCYYEVAIVRKKVLEIPCKYDYNPENAFQPPKADLYSWLLEHDRSVLPTIVKKGRPDFRYG